jgi:asparagine synthase (glutamine-hydrolysing)
VLRRDGCDGTEWTACDGAAGLDPEGKPGASIRIARGGRWLQLCRDLLGQRPLAYAETPQGIFAASGEALLRMIPGLDNALDLDYFAAHLAAAAPSPTASPWQAIRLLAPGEEVHWQDGRRRARRTLLESDDSWRGLADDKLIARHREMLAAAVARSLDGARRIGLSLSAGMDSGAILAMLAVQQHLMREPPLAVTYGFREWPEIDERPLAATACAELGIPWCGREVDALHPLAPRLRRPVCPDNPVASPFREYKEAAYAAFEAAGIDVWLDGHFGDHMVSKPADGLGSAVLEFRLGLLARESTRILQEHGARTLLTHPAWRQLGRRVFHRSAPWLPGLERLQEPWRKRMHDRLHAECEQWRGFPRPEQVQQALDAAAVSSTSVEQFHAQRHGMESRSPWRDLKLTRWCLSLPAHLNQREGHHKWLLREALRGLLPDAIRTRRKGSSLAPVLRLAFSTEHVEIERLRTIARPLVQSICESGFPEDDSPLWAWVDASLGQWMEAVGLADISAPRRL